MSFLTNKGKLFFLISQIPPGINQPPDVSSPKAEACPYGWWQPVTVSERVLLNQQRLPQAIEHRICSNRRQELLRMKNCDSAWNHLKLFSL